MRNEFGSPLSYIFGASWQFESDGAGNSPMHPRRSHRVDGLWEGGIHIIARNIADSLANT